MTSKDIHEAALAATPDQDDLAYCRYADKKSFWHNEAFGIATLFDNEGRLNTEAFATLSPEIRFGVIGEDADLDVFRDIRMSPVAFVKYVHERAPELERAYAALCKRLINEMQTVAS